MAEGSFQEKTEAPTPHRREEFRKKGKVAQSRELVSVISLLALTGCFYFWGDSLTVQSTRVIEWWFLKASESADQSMHLRPIMIKMFTQVATLTWPFVMTALVVGILSHIGQIGWVMSFDPVSPDFSRVNPLKGIQRLFSLRGFVELSKSLVKFTVIGGLVYFHFRKTAELAGGWVGLGLRDQIFVGMGAIGKLTMLICFLLLVVALLDFMFQRLDLERSMRMTKQEVREETKLREGDPLIRARVRSIQRERALRRMMQEIPKADVVITNPTHFAVALKYDSEKMAAPVVVAKGADYLAQKIKDLARGHSIPIVENKPLARILYRTIKVGATIPRDLYHAVAEILAYVYRLRNRVIDTRPQT